jgi:hypothetical protein
MLLPVGYALVRRKGIDPLRPAAGIGRPKNEKIVFVGDQTETSFQNVCLPTKTTISLVRCGSYFFEALNKSAQVASAVVFFCVMDSLLKVVSGYCNAQNTGWAGFKLTDC